MTTIETTLDAAPRGATPSGFQGRSSGRAIRNQIARIVMWAAFFLAMVPLVWILGSVVIKGGQLLLDSHWWANSQRGITARHIGGGFRPGAIADHQAFAPVTNLADFAGW